MSGLLSSAVWETIVAALGLALIYVALWSGLSLLGHEDIRQQQTNFTSSNLRTLKAQRYPARRSKSQ
jgi:hypothetical protein